MRLRTFDEYWKDATDPSCVKAWESCAQKRDHVIKDRETALLFQKQLNKTLKEKLAWALTTIEQLNDLMDFEDDEEVAEVRQEIKEIRKRFKIKS